jgi:nickel/cobalt transporter (NicO) family protein
VEPPRAAPPARPKPDERPVSPVARRQRPAGWARRGPGPSGRPFRGWTSGGWRGGGLPAGGRTSGGRPFGAWRARTGLLAIVAAGLLAAGAAPAAAHPLGNFTVNAYSGLRVGADRLAVDYVVDMAEIPTFQTRQAVDADHDGTVSPAEAATWRDHECPRLAAGLRAVLDGQPVALAVTGSALTFPEGVGGLETLRLECALTAPLPAARQASRSLTYADANHQGRVGWREISAVGDRTILESTDVPTTSTSARLTAYPDDQLSSPLDQRTATLRFHPGGPPAPDGPGPSVADGTARENPASRCEAPRRGSVADGEEGCAALSTAPGAGNGEAGPGPGAGNGEAGPGTGAGNGDGASAGAGRGGVDRATAAFTALVGGRSLSPGFAVVALLLAVGLGAAHALAPGHGKTVMAAYLVGLRGTLRQAATIGATVTLTHTAGVLLLGLVLTSSRAVASERVYPWLGLVSGLLLAVVGVGLLVRAGTGHHHPHEHGQRVADPLQAELDPGEAERPHGHDHGRDHHDPQAHPRPLGRRGLVALGLAGGLVPSPSAVVVLLGGIALGQAWFGVALVLAYGLGMAATLTGVGLLLAHLRTRMDRRLHLPAGSLLARAGRLLPAVTASVIVAVGLALAANGAAQL